MYAYVRVCILQILFLYRLLQNTEYSPLCYTVDQHDFDWYFNPNSQNTYLLSPSWVQAIMLFDI